MFRSSCFIKVLALLYLITLVHSFALPANGVVDPAEPPEDPEAPEDPELPEVEDPEEGEDEAPDDPNAPEEPPGELLGDLLKGITTPTGQSIANILLGAETGESSAPPTPPKNGGVNGCKNSKDTCCIWYSISADLTRDFKGPSGRCNDMARAAIRLGFHDAGTWSKKLAAAGQDYGGADGSLVLYNEIFRKENRGLEAVVILAKLYKAKYKVGMGDLIQYMANHATVTCPLGPRVRTFIGRKDATRAAPDGLLPSVSSDADTLISLFEDKTIPPHDLTALVGAHSTSKQFTTSLKDFGKPQDSSPGVWDVSFYNETISTVPNKKVFKFASDIVLSKDSRTSDEWNKFIGDQGHWNGDYARAYVRLSLLGVNVINGLTECTQTLPVEVKSFSGNGKEDKNKIYDQKRRRQARGEGGGSGGCTWSG